MKICLTFSLLMWNLIHRDTLALSISSSPRARTTIPHRFHTKLLKSKQNNASESDSSKSKSGIGSKREMIKFAVPALGIFLSQPLMSNIDNAFVGKTVGTIGLAALSPATICTDQMLYLFSFLSRATTGIVSRAYGSKDTDEESIRAANEAASTPLTFSIICGICLTFFYAILTPRMLEALNVDPVLRPASTAYIHWRGAIATFALVQSVCLSVMLATRDALTPLKIISLGALVNFIGDYVLCVIYPFGVTGAAIATAIATIFSSLKMLQDLHKRNLLPKLRIPNLGKLKELIQYVGPLFIITIARLVGFVSMQRKAMTFGTQNLAAYQICANCMVMFLLFGEPLSQLHQTKLPSFVDKGDKRSVIDTMKSVLTLSLGTIISIGLCSLLTLSIGAGIFTSDVAVQELVRKAAPSVSIAVMTAILAVTMDGAMLASKDFLFIILIGLLTCCIQLGLLGSCGGINAIFGTFTLRLGLYALAVCSRIFSGSGNLGKVIRQR